MELISYSQVEAYLLSLPGVSLDYPFGDDVAVYRVEGEMFALLDTNKAPVNLSLRCDPRLSAVLRDRYETVMPGRRLNQRLWNTLVLTGQLTWEEVRDLARHSYDLAIAADSSESRAV